MKHIKDGVGRANHRRVREPPENLVVYHADGGGSGESLALEGVVVVWQQACHGPYRCDNRTALKKSTTSSSASPFAFSITSLRSSPRTAKPW